MTQYKNRFLAMVKHPFFWTLTILGNSIILLGSFLLYQFESSGRAQSVQFIDCLLWSAGTVTTVGYGNFVAETFAGKITVLFLMFAGTLFVWSYMAFLVTGLIAPELSSLERDVHEVEKELHDLRSPQATSEKKNQ